MHQQIERTGHCQMIVGPTVQHVEIGCALLDETNDLGIHDRTAFDASRFLHDTGIAFGPIISVHREQSHTTVTDMDLQPIAVMLQLMRPTRTGWWLLGNSRLTGMDESSRRI